jgi:hypothetical protein
MDRSNRFLFQQAIFEGLSQRYEEELAENTENADCSKKHIARMRRFFKLLRSGTTTAKRLKRVLAAALIAAAVLLAGCTVYIFRGSVWESVVKIYKDHIEISFNRDNKGNSKPVEDIYAIGYMPEGYELKTDRSTPGIIYRVWENAESDRINFEQYSLFNSDILLNAEDGSTTMVECNGWEVYCRQYEDSCYYIWVDRSYYLMISVRGNVPRDEVLRIIESIELKAE